MSLKYLPNTAIQFTWVLATFVILNTIDTVPMSPTKLKLVNDTITDRTQIKAHRVENQVVPIGEGMSLNGTLRNLKRTYFYLYLGEARIILPKLDNNGTSLDKVREELEMKIVKLFGGFSHFEGFGGWQSKETGIVHHETVWFYDIALSNSKVNHDRLMEIASWLRDKAGQEAVYLRLPNGIVGFV